MRLAGILAAAMPLLAAAQVPRDQPREPVAATGTAVIRGRVTDRETGAAIPHVMISLSDRGTAPSPPPGPLPPGPPLAPPRQAQTDTDGRYVFEALAAATYTVLFTPPEFKVGYLPQAYGAARPTDMSRPAAPRPLTLADGQVLEGVDIALWRSLVVTGRVVDEFGDPLTGVPVAASYATGGQRAGVRGPYQIVTDDRGTFRLFGLAPGRYVLCAMTSQLSMQRDDARERYVKTCAPSVSSEAESQAVELTNSDFGEVEIRMQRGRAYRVTGTAADSQGAPVTQVSLVRVEGNGMSSYGAQVDGKGHFTFGGLTPGDYAVRAEVGSRMNPADTREREVGYVPFRIDGADLDGLVLTTLRGASIAGHVAFDGAPPAAGGIRISLRPPPAQSMAMLSTPVSTEVKPDLSFALPGIFGAQAVIVSGLPAGWIVRTVRTADRDITDLATDFKNGDRLEIVLTNHGARVAGQVVAAAGAATSDYRIVLFPAERERWTMPPPAGFVTPKPDGSFSVGPIRPGEYLIALVRSEDVPAPGAGMAAALERLAKIAQRATLLDDEQKQIDLTAER